MDLPTYPPQLNVIDSDPIETNDWLASINNVIEFQEPARAIYLTQKLIQHLHNKHKIHYPIGLNTPYCNSIPVNDEQPMPQQNEAAIRAHAIIRWNALAMVIRAGKKHAELGGHISTSASIADIYAVGFDHFFYASHDDQPGDLIFFQGHASPINYARAHLEGRISTKQLEYFRQESIPGQGLSSYPHPWLMPDFWQFPTVSMGLGAIQAIYQARLLKYLIHRGLLTDKNRKVWTFCGDGEMDEPESLGAITVAGRERLDNLVFIINCNLQRLDGPVRGNGKIIQELESLFIGAGWHVIKSLWDQHWDPLFAKDTDSRLLNRLGQMVDGQFQEMSRLPGSEIRTLLFGNDPILQQRYANLTDTHFSQLGRAGHDPEKIYACYARAHAHKSQPTVILIKSLKGYGLGPLAAGANTAHNTKKLPEETLSDIAENLKLPLTKDQAKKAQFIEIEDDIEAHKQVKAARKTLGGYLPNRTTTTETLKIPKLETFDSLLQTTGDRSISTTMVFVRFLSILLRDKNIKDRIVPIVPDESRTFGMEGLFRQIGIYSPQGQQYRPVDRDQIMYYREDKQGQYLQEGINEGGAFASWMAAATSYSNHHLTLIPFYTFYSMFGFQRIGDYAWAAGDMRARGFIMGATAGRTTLAGEGLQHQDGHSHVLAHTIPNSVTYDPTYSYELTVILHHGLKVMYQDKQDVFFYITLMNENYTHATMPKGVEKGIIQGMYPLKDAPGKNNLKVELMGCGAILREVEQAAELLSKDYKIDCRIWSVTSFNQLHKDALSCKRYNLLNPDNKEKVAYISQCLKDAKGPVIAATDYIQSFAESLRPYIKQSYHVLGTDGFGRSDTRAALRDYFEVNARWIAYRALYALYQEEKITLKQVLEARKKYHIPKDKQNPWET
jgi:pyruvate dehydrogenase E1 component